MLVEVVDPEEVEFEVEVVEAEVEALESEVEVEAVEDAESFDVAGKSFLVSIVEVVVDSSLSDSFSRANSFDAAADLGFSVPILFVPFRLTNTQKALSFEYGI